MSEMEVNVPETKDGTIEVIEEGSGEKVVIPDETNEETEVEPEGEEEVVSELPTEDTDEAVKLAIDTQAKTAEDVKATLAAKEVDFDALSQEYADKGNLAKETYDKLAEKGFPQSVVDAYIAGVVAINERFSNAVLKSVGGTEEYGSIQKYVAGKGKESVDAFNELVSTGNLPVIKMFLSGIKSEMVGKSGTKNPSLLGGNVSGKAPGFENLEAMTKAMADKRYGKDSAYTKEVEAKLKRSSIFEYNQ